MIRNRRWVHERIVAMIAEADKRIAEEQSKVGPKAKAKPYYRNYRDVDPSESHVLHEKEKT